MSENVIVCWERSRLCDHCASRFPFQPWLKRQPGFSPMRKLSVFLISVMSCCCTWLGVRAQDTNAGVIYFQHRTFTIPFNHEKNASIARLRLFVSSDQGRTWQQTAERSEEHTSE